MTTGIGSLFPRLNLSAITDGVAMRHFLPWLLAEPFSTSVEVRKSGSGRTLWGVHPVLARKYRQLSAESFSPSILVSTCAAFRECYENFCNDNVTKREVTPEDAAKMEAHHCVRGVPVEMFALGVFSEYLIASSMVGENARCLSDSRNARRMGAYLRGVIDLYLSEHLVGGLDFPFSHCELELFWTSDSGEGVFYFTRHDFGVKSLQLVTH